MPAAGQWKALVLAAGRGPDDPMARAFGARHKCLLEVGGAPMLARVVAALREVPEIGEIVITIDDAAAAAAAFPQGLPQGVRIVESADSASASVLRAMEEQGVAPPLLVTTADHALLRPEMVRHVLAGAEESGADLAIALARREVVLARHPRAARTWLPLGRDRVTSCNLFAVRTQKARKAIAFWRRAEKNRKRPWKIAAAFGPGALLRLAWLVLSGRGDARAVLRMLSARLGLAAAPVFMPWAEAAVDVDKPEDLELAKKILAERGAGGSADQGRR